LETGGTHARQGTSPDDGFWRFRAPSGAIQQQIWHFLALVGAAQDPSLDPSG
jgi:hypothetical protein